MYTTRFLNCRHIYVHQIVRPIGKFKINPKEHLRNFLNQIHACNCIIRYFIGDGPKRSNARDCLGHSSYFPCEFCFQKGFLFHSSDCNLDKIKENLNNQKNLIQNQIEEEVARDVDVDSDDSDDLKALIEIQKNIDSALKNISNKKKHIVWPSDTMNGEPRTKEKILEIVQKLEDDPGLSKDEAKGVVGRSLFLDIPYFNFIMNIVPEYMHGVCLGVGKRLFKLTFNVPGEKRNRNTKRKLSSLAEFTSALNDILFVKEFSRRARALDFSVMKAQEMRNIILFFFIIVIDCIEKSAKERRLWFLFSYLIRACVIPQNEFQQINPNVIEFCSTNFYTLYERLFGKSNCTYYTHLVGAHMPQIRGRGPLTMTSAFNFESFYGDMRQAFAPGTNSVLKQIFQTVLLKQTIGPHCCKASLTFSPKNTPRECNNLIYTYVQNEYQFYQIESVLNGSLQCQPIGNFNVSFPEVPTLDWSLVGVFRAGGVGANHVNVKLDEVAGKVIRIKNLLITCPTDVLLEK